MEQTERTSEEQHKKEGCTSSHATIAANKEQSARSNSSRRSVETGSTKGASTAVSAGTTGRSVWQEELPHSAQVVRGGDRKSNQTCTASTDASLRSRAVFDCKLSCRTRRRPFIAAIFGNSRLAVGRWSNAGSVLAALRGQDVPHLPATLSTATCCNKSGGSLGPRR